MKNMKLTGALLALAMGAAIGTCACAQEAKAADIEPCTIKYVYWADNTD